MGKRAEGHVIVCGYGIVGTKIVEQLLEKGVAFIIIDTDAAKVEKLRDAGYNVMLGDATRASVLKEAGIEGAKAIAVVLDNDAKNLFTVITARDMRKDIFIATRANDAFVKEKLVEAGANQIVMPQITACNEIMKEISKMRAR
ncbi:MAG: NAD-binding protein [Candidatus Micrarchaeota archaeon]|nr:NAD-binding protein [Candidatus Micrarchaeota archaeon]